MKNEESSLKFWQVPEVGVVVGVEANTKINVWSKANAEQRKFNLSQAIHLNYELLVM